MFGQTFYHGHLRKYVVLFGTLFNDIYINRVSGNNYIDSIKVPITYGPADAMLARVEADAALDRPIGINLPRMSFELTNISYSPIRKLPTIQKAYTKVDPNNPSSSKYLYNPVPYDLDFTLNIAVKNTEDGTRILEQILPFFSPEWTVTVNLIPEMDVKLDIPTTLISVTSQDTYESDYVTRRSLVWTLDFSMKGYIFGPVKKAGVITLANTNFSASSIVDTPAEVNITVTPGLLANGSPTTNASLTIDRDQISSDDNYDYIITNAQVTNQ
jgi:hypothetical protein